MLSMTLLGFLDVTYWFAMRRWCFVACTCILRVREGVDFSLGCIYSCLVIMSGD